ncbi:ribose ABC transporter permease [Oceanispirochaeta sp.]|uniref:ABC transporter permease n=1 Tax=Oceanispirochaeta sp. TaxID=2035350 RepID=UPI00263747D3|nr:ribose ABC transporter permease [Oceanispirochaeta sp.]MDA3958254.1 ribose ABC transporter permease [Oceanispirochaeta sp.]
MKPLLQDLAGNPWSYKIVILGVQSYLKRYGATLIGLFVLGTVMTIMSPVFLTSGNLINIMRQVSTNGMLAMAMTFVILTGGIDLSVGSVMAFTGTFAAGLIAISGLPVSLAVGIALLSGVLIGSINGLIIASTGIAPFIVTLGMMNIVRGFAYIYTGGLPVRVALESYNRIGLAYLGPIPFQVIYLIILFAILDLVLKRTTFGRHVYAVGDSTDAAYFAGIKVRRIRFSVYALSGFITAFTGVVLSARLYSGQPSAGQGSELDAVAACVLGGMSMTGGTGRLMGALLGAMVIGVLNNGLNLLNINSFWQLVVKGLVILIAVYLDDLKKRN